jgi:hypothetical protein
MNANEQERLVQLLNKSVSKMGDQAGKDLRRDLWPAMLRRLEAGVGVVPWFDWALLAAVAVWLAFFPGAIPVLLFHL